MITRSALFAFAALLLLPLVAAAEAPSTHGPYTYSQLTPYAQQLQTHAYYDRLREDWRRQHRPPKPWVELPDTERGMEAAQRDYTKRHPNDRPDLWRFKSRDDEDY